MTECAKFDRQCRPVSPAETANRALRSGGCCCAANGFSQIVRLFVHAKLVTPLFLAMCFVAQAFSAELPDVAFLVGLRERGLYRLAEKHGQERWGDEEMASADRVLLAIELARTYAEWAVSSPPRERNTLWEKAHAVAADCIRTVPDAPRRILIDVQDALTWLAAGEIARVESGDAVGQAAFDVARDRLRRAIRDLERLAESVETMLREQRLDANRTAKKEEGELSVAELDGLGRHLAIELARALRNQALCFPTGSPDRVNALTRALEYLDQPGMADEGHPHRWRVRLDALACHRLLGHGDEVRRQMRAILEDEPPDFVALRIEAERVRLLLAEGDLRPALAAVAKGRTIGGLASPQLDMAHLEVLLAARAAAGASPEHDHSSRISAQVQRIRQTHSPAWARRAEMLVGRAFATSTEPGAGGGNVDTLRLAAENLYRAGKLEEAIEAYDRASVQAAAAENDELAFSLAFTAAAIRQRAGTHEEAMEQFEQLAFRWPKHPRAGESHRLAVYSAAALARLAIDDETRREALGRFSRMLTAHTDQWPDSSTADESWFWQGNLHKTSRDWDRAQQDYRHVRPKSEHFEAAVENAAICYERFLAMRKRQGVEPVVVIDAPAEEVARANIAVPKLAQEATTYLQPVITGTNNRWPDPWSSLQRKIALPLARIQLDYAENPQAGREYAMRLLVAALASAGERSDADANWQARTNALLAAALFLQEKPDEAAEIVSQIPAEHTATLVPFARRAAETLSASRSLSHVGGGDRGGSTPIDPSRPPNSHLQKQGELVLHVVDRLDTIRETLGIPAKKESDTARAAALVAVGRRDEALQIYARLVEEHAADGHLHEARAAVLGQADQLGELQAANRAWIEVERRSTKGGERWFRARIARCELLIRLSRHQEATKLIRLTKVIFPDLGGAVTREAFERLAQSAAKR